MAFDPKDWENDEVGGTKLNAAALIDLEERVTDYADSQRAAIVATDYGAVGNGTTDDTTALQAAITAAITAKVPLFLPAGTYKITSGLVANTTNFCMFGAGMRVSLIAPSAASFDALTIGPGAGGSGNVPGGYCRDFGFKGGGATAEITKKAVTSTTGKAAFKLSGMRLFEITNVGVMEGSFDIGFDLVNNSFGAIFTNCRTDFGVCRVGMNIREADQSGNDSNWHGCWFSGEVACVHISGNAGGFHFWGGQLNVNRQGTTNEDGKGAIIIGKDYTSGSTSGDTVNVDFNGMDFEECIYAWFCRGYGEHSLAFRDCAFLANGSAAVIGVYKNSAYKNGRTVLENCRVKGTFSANANALATVEGGFGGRTWVETATSGGGITTGSGEVDVNNNPLAYHAKLDFSFAVGAEYTVMPREMLMRRASGGEIETSGDWGTNWTKVGSSYEEKASANTMTISRGVSVVKVTGTAEIKKINATIAGHVVTLIFASTAKIVDGENLKLIETKTASADETMQLVCDGTNWYQTSPLAAN